MQKNIHRPFKTAIAARIGAVTVLALCFAVPLGMIAVADEEKIDSLKAKIDERTKAIEAIKKEITAFQEEIKVAGKEVASLKGTIKTLDATQKKLGAELRVTEGKIYNSELTIDKLALEIRDKENRLKTQSRGLSEALRKFRELESQSLFESLLSLASLSVLWGDTDNREKLIDGIELRIGELNKVKTALVSDKAEVEKVREELRALETELSDRKKLVEYNKQTKNEVLLATKNKEQNYKKLVEEKNRQKEAFENELFEFESQLKFELDQSKIPERDRGILSWPVDNPVVTQFFGATKDARRLYVSGTHNGIDLRAPNGTPIKAVLAGVVDATGNTDLVKGCYSYGKWLLLKHGNGLSTLYAHLSVISVMVGQELSTGQLVGYSGATGYATGPHLHFSVYASGGVSAQKYVQGKSCKDAVMPVAARNAYLDPIDYLKK